MGRAPPCYFCADGAKSKPPGINLGPEESRTRSRGLDWASGCELKGRLYSQKKFEGLFSSLSADLGGDIC